MFKRRLITLLAAVAIALPLGAGAGQAATKCATGYSSKTCATTTSRAGSTFVVGYRDSIINGKSYAINGTCQASVSKTVSHSVSTSVTASVKGLIFASMDATLSANIDKSMTTGYVTSAAFKVPAKSTVKCDRGIYTEKANGYTTLTWYSAGKGGSTKTNWSSTAPSRAAWHIY